MCELYEAHYGSKLKSPSLPKHANKQKAQMESTVAHRHAVSVWRVQSSAYCDHGHSSCSAVDLDSGVKVLPDLPSHWQLMFFLWHTIILINIKSHTSATLLFSTSLVSMQILGKGLTTHLHWPTSDQGLVQLYIFYPLLPAASQWSEPKQRFVSHKNS